MKTVIVFLSILAATHLSAQTRYYIELSHNDELFIINGERYDLELHAISYSIEGENAGIMDSNIAILFSVNNSNIELS